MRFTTSACVMAFGVAGVLASAGSASAAVIHATTVESFSQGLNSGGSAIEAARSDPTKALGAPQDNDTVNFVSLGFGGELVLGFDEPFLAESVLVIETTYGAINSHREQADVYIGYVDGLLGTQWTFAGTVQNTADHTPLDLTGLGAGSSEFTLLRLVDRTGDIAGSTSTDGFDVDGVAVVPVPTPGAGVLAMAGVLLVSRRRRA